MCCMKAEKQVQQILFPKALQPCPSAEEKEKIQARSRIHVGTISLRFLGMIFYTMFTLQTSFKKNTFSQEGAGESKIRQR
jgi:hypothetical protein